MITGRQLFKCALCFFVLLSVAAGGNGKERKKIEDVAVQDLSAETQQKHFAAGVSFTHVWWVPIETFRALWRTFEDEQTREVLKSLDPLFLIYVLHSDIDPSGGHEFRDWASIARALSVRYVDARAKTHRLEPLQNTTVAALREVLDPLFAKMGGTFGENFQLFAFSDRDENGRRLVSPYERGQLIVELKDKTNEFDRFTFECPLNSLFVPRTCSECNREMHVAWIVCPWDATLLQKEPGELTKEQLDELEKKMRAAGILQPTNADE